MRIHLINPSDVSFGIGVITPRWLFVLAEATPREFGDPIIVDETLELLDPNTIAAGDIVGIGIHTGNALRGYKIGRIARERGARVVFGGIHATLFPEEAQRLGCADAVVKGDGDIAWVRAIRDCVAGTAPIERDEGDHVHDAEARVNPAMAREIEMLVRSTDQGAGVAHQLVTVVDQGEHGAVMEGVAVAVTE